MATPDVRPQDLQVLRSLFGRFPKVREVVLFGSRATGTARRASDIDLAVSAPEASAEEWLALREAIDEAPIIFEFDVVRREALASESLRRAIDRDGVRIYPVA
jgi:predicted nucleotidyltransferase